MGGAMMVVLGHKLAEDGFSPLAWYGALYPFEIVLTTGFTGVFRRLNEVRHAHVHAYEGPCRPGSRRYTSAPRRAFSGTRAAHFHREAVAKLGAAAGQCRPVWARRPVRLSVLVVRGAAAAGRLLAPGRVALPSRRLRVPAPAASASAGDAADRATCEALRTRVSLRVAAAAPLAAEPVPQLLPPPTLLMPPDDTLIDVGSY